MDARTFAAIGLLAFAAPAPARAANLLPGASFDSEPELLANFGNLGPNKIWSSEDLDGLPTSGSLSMANSHDTGGTGAIGDVVFSSCVPVVPGATVRYGGWQFTDVAQSATGFVRVQLQFRESCPVGAFTGAGDIWVDSTTIGAWTLLEGEAAVPPAALGARLELVAAKSEGQATGTFTVLYDEVFLPEPDPLGLGATAALGIAGLASARRRRLIRPTALGCASSTPS